MNYVPKQHTATPTERGQGHACMPLSRTKEGLSCGESAAITPTAPE
jgi:hypothetical protein